MGLFALGIEHPLDVTVQRSHDPNPRHHRRTATAAQHQCFDRGLPFRQDTIEGTEEKHEKAIFAVCETATKLKQLKADYQAA
jgi:hypothetical protein